MIQTCGKKIELGNTGIPVTYCILTLGHAGKCEPDPFIQERYEGKLKDAGQSK